jgi:hypothetical protein
MCSLCGSLGIGPAWEQEGLAAGEVRWQLQRELAATAKEVTQVMRAQRIKLTASPQFGYLVEFPTGGSEVVSSLMELWHVIDRHAASAIDPFDA